MTRATQHLPVNVFESLIEIVDGQPRVLFTRVQYTLATEEAERIGVDHIARSSISGSTQTSAGTPSFSLLLLFLLLSPSLHYVVVVYKMIVI